MSLLDKLSEVGMRGARHHCPECDPHKEHSRSIKINDKSFKCFRCGIEGGSQQCLSLFKIELPKMTAELDRKERLREVAWVVYSRNRKQAEDYLIARGYPESVLDLEFGYAELNTLQKAGMSKLDLESIGLLTSNGAELFRERVVFPIRAFNDRLTHFQARSIESDSKCKWLATADKTYGPLSSALYGNHLLQDWSKSNPTVILCEGISDAIALHCIGLPAIASFGIYDLNLDRHLNLKNFDVVAMYDNDRFALSANKNSGESKSWSAILPQLCKLQRSLNDGCKVYTLDIPNLSGVKDTFDLCQYLDWSKESTIEYGGQNAQPLSKKIVDTYGLSDPADAVKCLAGVPLDSATKESIEEAVLKNGGWLNVIERAFY